MLVIALLGKGLFDLPRGPQFALGTDPATALLDTIARQNFPVQYSRVTTAQNGVKRNDQNRGRG